MVHDKSDWKLPKDMLVLFSVSFVVPSGTIFLACFLPMFSKARRGDPTLFWITVSIAIVGVVLLFIAKLSIFRQGKFFTFGTKVLPEKHKKIYRFAYCLIVASMIIMLLLLAMFEEMK